MISKRGVRWIAVPIAIGLTSGRALGSWAAVIIRMVTGGMR